MIIDILSDLHVDFYFKKKPTKTSVRHVYSRIFRENGKREETGEMLIVAGDIGHYNKQNIQVLELIQSVFGYKHIVCVLGNHDYWLLDRDSEITYCNNSLFRVDGMRNLLNRREGMYCLDGDIIEIDGIKIGGCDGWYDGEYIKKNFDDTCPVWGVKRNEYYINNLWKQCIADHNYIYNMSWQGKAVHEKQKIEKIYRDVDIMITHINPSIDKAHSSVRFAEEEATGFFTFDGSKYLRDGRMKYWVYGHTHDSMEYEAHGVTCICNPMGYPNEANSKIMSIEI